MFENSRDFAQKCDAEDALAPYREAFSFPRINGKDALYFVGNSLGLQPILAEGYVKEVMESWKTLGVEGHFHGGRPWWDYHERLIAPLAKVVGALPEEITVMNTLTVNLHLLMVSFYRPDAQRFKILCEEKAFPSDQYLIKSQLRCHGLDPEDALIEVAKKGRRVLLADRGCCRQDQEAGASLALVLIGGVNYYNGQVFDMPAITKAVHGVGATVGWDLAHAAGNVALELHKWGVDFAAWCSYKYMNSGPGNASGIFVHQKHLGREDIPRFEGWWGNQKESRFMMRPDFEPMPTAEAWQLSNPPVLSLAPYLASLQLFDAVGMKALVQKSEKLTGYLEFILQEVARETEASFEVITPPDRGCQLSVFLHGYGRELFDALSRQGVMADWREPNVIRLAPAPFYCSFSDVFEFGRILKAEILAR